MTTSTETRSAVLGVLADVGIEVDALTDATRFRDELDVDSTELVEISVALERALGIAISSAEFAKIETVGDLIRLIDS
ncbi:MAG TPA: acyl carrier protein [Mycobacteriales bacterium]